MTLVVGLLMLAHTSLTPAGAGAVTGLVVASRAHGPTQARPAVRAHSSLVLIAVTAAAAAGAVHAMAGSHHASESLWFGCFFFVTACVQFLWGTLALVAPSRRLWGWGIVMSLALVSLWLVTRTVGVPGLLAREEIGAWDVAATAWELVTLACCTGLWAGRPVAAAGLGKNASQRSARLVYSVLAVSATALVVLATVGSPGGPHGG